MTSLQQANSTPLEGLGDGPEWTTDCILLAVHRRSNTALYMSKVQPDPTKNELVNGELVLMTIQHLNPTPVGRYLLSSDVKAARQILECCSLESYDAFIILVNAPIGRQALFFNLNLQLVANTNLMYMHDQTMHPMTTMACADFDQKRKDLLIGTNSGRLFSFAVRLVTKVPNGGKGRIMAPIKTIQAIQRGKVKIDTTIGQKAVQICTVDINSTLLVLYDTGVIQCMESVNLEPLWTVPGSSFRDPPIRVWADKFGCQFVVYCRSESTSSVSLEMWMPPESYNLCMTGHFYRCLIPLMSENVGLKGVCIESISSRSTHVIVAQGNGQLQLWLLTGENFQLVCSMLLATPKMLYSLPTLHINFKEPSASVRSKISILIASCNDMTEVALHYPSESDSAWIVAGQALEREVNFFYIF